MGVEGSTSSSSSETVDDSGSEPDNSLVFQVNNNIYSSITIGINDSGCPFSSMTTWLKGLGDGQQQRRPVVLIHLSFSFVFVCSKQDNNLVSGPLDALLQHLVPTAEYYPDRTYIFAFLLSSRLYIKPHALLAQVVRLCMLQQNLADQKLTKV